ncbi:alanine racemase [Putridiphycobacter roseus]|uniref:Alanine racemase n=1 Tax=Putridiphycobacter roseus TaxID=2219161 RepID=A0A2W1NFC8_9FLAO|nr:alanine racemase [Putridiphycobacter roseus]PZE17803.1 alanine racemase [Putridiphycobacter roseus]
MSQTSYITLSRSALKNNVEFIQNILGTTKFSSVVKGNAYGHGIKQFCPLIHELGVDHFSVFSADEAQKINAILPHVSIQIMGFIHDNDLEWVIKNKVSFFVFESDRLNKAIQLAQKLKIKAKINIEIETGMNRTGFHVNEFDAVIKVALKAKKHIIIEGICSHLAGAESISNYKRVKSQIKTFSQIQHKVKENKQYHPKFHLACSAAILQYPKTKFDLARIGILQYGFFPSNEVLVQYITKNSTDIDPLKRVITWKTIVMDTNTIEAGSFVGYGTSFFTNSKTKVALIPVGYSHGFSRSLSNQGKVLIRGKRLDVIGTVNMNMTAIDITECPEIEKGDEVVLIGTQGDNSISVASFSDFSNLLNYELLTRLPSGIKRKIIA